jgi:adenylate cyclase
MDLLRRVLKHLSISLGTFLAHLLRDRRVYLRLQFGSALGLGVGLMIAAAIISGILGVAPARLSDFLYRPPPPTGQVVIVAIDDASLKENGAWPWSRTTIAALINAMAAGQPRVVGLDLILPEPASDDAALTAAILRVPVVVQPVVGVEATRHSPGGSSFPRFDFVLDPAPALQTPTTRLGHTMSPPDADGIVRHIPVAIESAGKRYPAFGVAALEVHIEDQTIALGARQLPVDSSGRLKITFVTLGAEGVISARDVLGGRVRMNALRDKIVLVGLMSSAMPEHSNTPLSANRHVYGVEIQASVIETILGNHFLVQQDRLTEIVMVFLLAILAGATLPHFRLLTAFALTIIYFLLYLGYAFQKFDDGVLVQPLYPILALFGVFLGAMVFRYFSQERRRESIMRLFRRYVAPEAVEQVTRDFDRGVFPLGGARRVISVVCIDLRDLTRLAGSLNPAVLFDLLNQYAGLIVASIFRHDGAISKHTGEEIMATWNLLSDQADHARQALSAAMEIKREIGELAQKQPTGRAVKEGIGISTGEVIAGRIGAAARAEYTIVGEIISIAERLAAKPERSIFIDAATFACAGDEVQTRQVKPIKLRRETDPQQVWQVLMPTELEEESGAKQTPPDAEI